MELLSEDLQKHCRAVLAPAYLPKHILIQPEGLKKALLAWGLFTGSNSLGVVFSTRGIEYGQKALAGNEPIAGVTSTPNHIVECKPELDSQVAYNPILYK